MSEGISVWYAHERNVAMGLRAPELIVILIIALVIFGPKNLPRLGKSLGQTVKNVREGMEGDEQAKAPVDAKAAVAIEDVAEADGEDVRFCTKCGAKNAADATFCSTCGQEIV